MYLILSICNKQNFYITKLAVMFQKYKYYSMFQCNLYFWKVVKQFCFSTFNLFTLKLFLHTHPWDLSQMLLLFPMAAAEADFILSFHIE